MLACPSTSTPCLHRCGQEQTAGRNRYGGRGGRGHGAGALANEKDRWRQGAAGGDAAARAGRPHRALLPSLRGARPKRRVASVSRGACVPDVCCSCFPLNYYSFLLTHSVGTGCLCDIPLLSKGVTVHLPLIITNEKDWWRQGAVGGDAGPRPHRALLPSLRRARPKRRLASVSRGACASDVCCSCFPLNYCSFLLTHSVRTRCLCNIPLLRESGQF
jgi:hypothetical protein